LVYIEMGLKIVVNSYAAVWLYKEQVDEQGLKTDRDYTWRYIPATNDWLSSPISPATVEFDFQDRQWETYFQLKWAK
jgi:hypothetical protein